MENYDRFKKVTDLCEKEYRILESIRFQDNDQSVKAGAVLAFSGLMIATSIVQLSTSPSSVVYVGNGDAFLLILNVIGLFLLFLSSVVTIVSLVSKGKYSNNKKEALNQFDDYVKNKSKLVKTASLFVSGGAVCVLLALMTKLIGNIF